MYRVEIVYYTDPLCCWSWGMEPAINRLKYEYHESISWRHCMGGLLPGWKNFVDPVNNVTRPIQMGPVWMHAAQVSGMPMDQNIWHRTPPASSYPAGIAFKSVELQSPAYAETYLRMMRSACMIDGIDIGNADELIALAHSLKLKFADFDVKTFIRQLTNGEATEAFKSDLQEIKIKGITRFPTLLFRSQGGGGLLTTGYRPYATLLEALHEVCPGIQKTRDAENLEEYRRHCPWLTDREINEAAPVHLADQAW